MRQIRGPNGVAMTGYRGPSDAPKTGQEAGRCSYMTNYIYVLHMRCMHKVDRTGGGGEIPKIVL